MDLRWGFRWTGRYKTSLLAADVASKEASERYVCMMALSKAVIESK